jgi:hypothetical protein
MKMDAMLKRRMWKVAIAHFILTLIVVSKLYRHRAWSGPMEARVWFDAWGSFWSNTFSFLDPQFYLLEKLFYVLPNPHVNLFYWHFSWELTSIISVPLWSLCFGWLFVKFDNWLNHFPVLGKRVF